MADRVNDYSTDKIDTTGIGQTIDEIRQSLSDQRRTHERRWYDNNFFDDGFHFRYVSRSQNKIVDLSERANVYAPLRAIPKASRQIRGVANLLLSSDPTPVIYPEKVNKHAFPSPEEYEEARKEAKWTAQMSGHWLEEEMKKQLLQEKLALMVILAAKHGVSYMQVWPDAVDEAVRTQVYDGFDIYLMGALNDIKEQPVIIKGVPRLIAQIKADERFSEEGRAQITPDNRQASSEIKEAYLNARQGRNIALADQTATLIQKEAYLKEYLNQTNLPRIQQQENAGEILGKKKMGDPIIRQVFVAGNICLRDEYTTLPEYPFIDYRFEPGPMYQVPLIERFIPANKSLDMAISRTERFGHTMITGTWLKQQGQQFSMTNQAGGQVIEYTGTPPVQGNVSSVPNFWFNFMELLTGYIEEQGVTTNTLGKIPKGVKANAAIESLKESEFANLVIPQRRLRETVKSIAERMLDIADSHFVRPQTVYYLEKGEPQYFDVIGATALKKRQELGVDDQPLDAVPLKKDYRVEIEIESGMGYTKSGQKATMLELISNVLLPLTEAGHIPPEAVKVAVEKTLEVYQFGSTAEFMTAMTDYMSEGRLTDEQMEKIKVAVLEVMKDLHSAGVLPTSEQRIEETKVGVAEVINDVQGAEGQGKEEVVAKPPSESIGFKDLPASGKVQMAAQAGIEISEEEVKEQESKQEEMDKAKLAIQAKKASQKPTKPKTVR